MDQRWINDILLAPPLFPLAAPDVLLLDLAPPPLRKRDRIKQTETKKNWSRLSRLSDLMWTWTPLFGEIEVFEKETKIPGNALSDVLLKSCLQNFVADSAKKNRAAQGFWKTAHRAVLIPGGSHKSSLGTSMFKIWLKHFWFCWESISCVDTCLRYPSKTLFTPPSTFVNHHGRVTGIWNIWQIHIEYMTESCYTHKWDVSWWESCYTFNIALWYVKYNCWSRH